MSIAITDDHRSLEETAQDFLEKRDARGAARALLEASAEESPPFWDELRSLGWLGLHVPEEYGGSGYGLPELVVVVEQLGRFVAPGAFVPTVITSAVLADAGTDELRNRYLPGLTDGSTVAGVAMGADVELRDGAAHGSAGAVLGADLADILLVAHGDDVLVVDCGAEGVAVEMPPNIDPTRRSGRVSLDGAPAEVLSGAGSVATALARTILAAEATGIARECTDAATEYAKEREQFGRPIAMFQAVKHHCANMLVATELATAAVWDAARATASGGDQFSLAAAIAATLAVEAADFCAQHNVQVHGGIGMTFEHDAHLYLRRAVAVGATLDAEAASRDITRLTREGVQRKPAVELPPDAEAFRSEVRAFVAEADGLDDAAVIEKLMESGYVMPHWPKPWGRAADAIEQLVIDQEFSETNIKRPQLGITGWVILTLIQHGTDDQVARWVRPALTGEVVWCQLFSEPDAGSDAAAVKTRATRVDGGWLVNGQKVWTSGAHRSQLGLATVRTDPDVPKHNGITTMVIDMTADEVEVRPLRMPSGHAEFNEVFFNDVFVPDDDVVGSVDQGWTVARATLGNERVSIGGGQGGMSMPGPGLVEAYDQHPERLAGGEVRVGRYVATDGAMKLLNLRSAERAVAGGPPGPEGNITKLVLAEIGHEARALLVELAGHEAVFLDGEGAMSGMLVLLNRAMSIAGGTSEITRNQIAERILGLPRDPLIV